MQLVQARNLMFGTALAGGLHFDVQTITDEVVTLGFRAAPLIDSGRPETWDHQGLEYQQLAEQSDLNTFIHLLPGGLPCRLPSSNDCRHRRPRVALPDQNGVEDIFADWVKYLLV